jgi:RHS repeat-associated protein
MLAAALLLLMVSTQAGATVLPIDLGDEVQGSIAAGEERVYGLSGLAPGQRVYLARTGGSNVNQMSWSLADRFGRIITQDLTGLGDLGPVSLIGGEYTVTVRGRTAAASGSFAFIVHAVEDSAGNLALDQIASSTLAGVGATHRFTLDLPAAQPLRLLFGGPASANQLSYRLIDAAGNLRVDWSSSAPVASELIGLPAGPNRIEVRGRNQYAGAFSLRARPQIEPVPTALVLDTPAPYASVDVSETVAWSLALAAPTRIYPAFAFGHVGSAAQWRLVRDDGQVVVDWGTSLAALAEPLNLGAGDYVLSLRSRAATPVSGTLTVHEVIDVENSLAPGSVATAFIDTPGQEQRFQLVGVPAGMYLLDQRDTDNRTGLGWRLDDALGRTVLARTGTVDDVEAIALQGGDYTLTVSGNDAATGFVDFALGAVTVADLPASPGTVIDDAILAPGEIRRYTFSAPTGLQLAVALEASSNAAGLNYILHDAAGREIIARTSALPALTERRLAGGDYRLTVLGEGGETGSFRLALDDPGNSGFVPSGTPLGLDTPTNATITSAAPQQWQLSLPATERVYFELLQGASNLRWTLFDAGGEAVFGNARAAFPGTDDRGAFVLAAGDYTLEFELTGAGPADYAFRAVDAAVVETVLDLDLDIDSAPTVPGFRNEYVLDVPADGQFYFEVLEGVSPLRWRLVDDAGRAVFGPARAWVSDDSVGSFALRAGQYRLVFEATTGAAPAYRFRVHSVSDFAASLSLGATPLPVAGSMAMPGQHHEYELTLEPGVERLYIQVQSGNNALRYSLLDAAGRRLVDRRRLSFVLSDDIGPLIVEPGEYRLLIEMASPTTAGYALTLHAPEPASTEATALDQLESWTPAGPGDERRYTFDVGPAGSRAFFDPRSSGQNVFATLTHLPSGWSPFADVHLQLTASAVRGPFDLPEGEYELRLRALASAGAPSWQLSSVVDPPAVAIGVNEVVVAEFPMPGAQLSYTFVPEQDGQSLIFDLMSATAGNRWELLDPVGTPVFGPANAADFASHDQGPLALADGSYTLNFFNPANQERGWLFRVGSAGGVITVPEGCAACSALDLVFTFDTSVSMDPVNQAMCDLAADLVQALADDGIPVNANYWGITENGTASCLSGNVLEQLGGSVPDLPSGPPPPWMADLENCAGFPELPTENWGPAAAIVAERYPWQSDAVRLLVPVADEGPYCGDPVDEFDIDSVYFARQVAAGNDVVVSPLLPDIAPDPVRAMAGLITVGTGGVSTVADFDVDDILPVARGIAVAACGTQQAVAVPQFSELSPLPGSLLPAGQPVVISGRVAPVNALRPVLSVEINGQPAAVLDGSGSFFATVELQPGPNQVTIAAVEGCGPTVLETELFGAGDSTDPWSGIAEITELLEPEFSSTTYDRTSERLLVDVSVLNPGAPLRGPLLMAVGTDLDPGVRLLAADGVTPNGEAYVTVLAEGELLDAGARSAPRELAFANPGRAAIDFQPRWLLPANQPPHFTSIPTTSARVGQVWSYPVEALDGNGDAVTLSLLTAPPGMSIDAGRVEWTPSAAGTHDVVLRASDGRGGSARQSFVLTVAAAGFNAPPVFTTTPPVQAPTGADYVYAATALDPDGDAPSFSLVAAPAGMNVDAGAGTVTWAPAQAGQHAVILQAEDPAGAIATQSYTLFVGEPAGLPPGPSFVSTPVTAAAAEVLYRYRPQFAGAPNLSPALALVDGPAGMSLAADGATLEWLPTATDLGPHPVELLATDGDGQQARQRYVLNVLVELPNQPPYFVTSAPLAAVAGQPWNYAAEAIDPEFQGLAYRLEQAPPTMQVDAATGELSWTPDAGGPALEPVRLVAEDPAGAVAVQQFEIAVRAGNAAPVLTGTPPASVLAGRTLTHLFIGQDADGDRLHFELIDAPPGMRIDAEAGWLSWSTLGVAPGSYDYQVRLSDDWGGSDQKVFNIAVVEDLEDPVVRLRIGREPACLNEAVQICVEAGDNVGIDSVSLAIDGVPQTLSATCAEWTPDTLGMVQLDAGAVDLAGRTGTVQQALQSVDCNDEQRPVVSLVSPAPESLLLEPTPLIASIDDNTPAALSWTVTLRAGEDGEPVEIASGSGAVDAVEIARIDPTVLPEGDYRIAILASDGAQTGGIEYRVLVGKGYKPGRLRFASADLTLDLGGLPLSLGRTYDSLDTAWHAGARQDFGPGWRLDLSASVRDSARDADPASPSAIFQAEAFTDDTRVYVIKPDGERVGFRFAPTPRGFPGLFQFDVAFEADPGVTDTLRAVDGPSIVWALGAGYGDWIIPYNPTTYELETEDRVVYVINETEGLVQVRDALGGVLDISADGVISSRGLTVDFVRDDQGRIAEIRVPPAEPGGPPGRVLYEYDGIGNLVGVTDLAGGVSSFEYGDPDYPHHVTALFDQLGQPLSSQVYDDQGRLAALCPPDGNTGTLEGCSEFSFDVTGGVETVFDARGFRSDLFYDADGLLSARRDWVDDSQWLEQQWVYDDRGREIEFIDAAGGRTRTEYDEQGNRTARILPGGQRFEWRYEGCRNQWVESIDPQGNRWQRTFDEACRLRFRTDPLGGVTEFQYDPESGLRSAVIDPTGQEWSFTFSPLGGIATATDPRGGTRSHQYDELGRRIVSVARDGQQLQRSYDDGGRLRAETWVGQGVTRSWDYNARGANIRESGPAGALVTEYWPTGRIRRIDFDSADGPDWWVEYDHDGNGNVVAVRDSSGAEVVYEYDGLDRMIAVAESGPGVLPKRVELDYNEAGLVVEIRRFGDLAGNQPGPVTEVAYRCPSCAGELQRITHRRPDTSVIEELLYSRDERGQITQITNGAGVSEFVYDGRGWLVEWSLPPLPGLVSGSSSYDAMGNWRSRPGQSGPVQLSMDTGEGGHLLLDDGQRTYIYSPRGALISRTDSIAGETLTLAYDALDRPISVQLTDDQGGVVSAATYRYTPGGARVTAEVNGLRRHFIHDGQNVIAALDDVGDPVWRRLHGRAVDRPFAVDDGQQIRWLLSDHNGTVHTVVDTAGQPLAEFVYTPFGRQVAGPPPSLDDAVRYTGREFDVPGGLAYYRARLYDPAIARFVSEDPLEPWHYRYADNTPLRFSDPSGESVFFEFLGLSCTLNATFSFASTGGKFVTETLTQANDGLFGIPGDIEKIFQIIVDASRLKNNLPCGFGDLL